MEPSQSFISYEVRDGVATITLNRPEKLNAFNDDMVRQLATVFHRFDMDENALVAILCGAGRAFSSGADVRQRQLRNRDELQRGGGPAAADAKSSELLSHMDAAHELASALTRNPPLAVRAIVMARRWALIDSRCEFERYASLNKLYLTEDFAEAACAFAEKRPAGPFKGR